MLTNGSGVTTHPASINHRDKVNLNIAWLSEGGDTPGVTATPGHDAGRHRRGAPRGRRRAGAGHGRLLTRTVTPLGVSRG